MAVATVASEIPSCLYGKMSELDPRIRGIARTAQFLERIQRPPGRANHQKPSSPFCKNILIFRRRKSPYIPPRPVPTEGRRDRHERGAGCGGRGCALCDEGRVKRTAKSCGSGARSWRQVGRRRLLLTTVATELGSPGDHDISRKAIAQGRPDALRWTCMLVCAISCAIAHETAGAARTRSSLRPLSIERAGANSKARAKRAARSRSCVCCLKFESGDCERAPLPQMSPPAKAGAKYSRASVINREGAAYWIHLPAFAGMTTVMGMA